MKEILEKYNFKFNKAFGQNFISDPQLLAAIASDAGVTQDDTVVEIGAGAGALSRQLCARAKKVIIYEIDLHLKEVLAETLSSYSNYQLIFEDFMKQDMDEFQSLVGDRYKVVANLPYYITTPIIFKFLENRKGLQSLTIMVQKEVADRMVAPFNTENYGALSCMVNFYATVKITRKVNRKMFYPVPNVDSAIVNIVFDKQVDESIEKTFSRLVKSAFAMRRKTFVNNLMSSFNLSREAAEKILIDAGYDIKIRGEALSVNDFQKLAKAMK